MLLLSHRLSATGGTGIDAVIDLLVYKKRAIALHVRPALRRCTALHFSASLREAFRPRYVSNIFRISRVLVQTFDVAGSTVGAGCRTI